MAFGNVRSGYPLPLSVARLFGQPIVVVNAAALNRSPWYEVRNEASKVINDMGIGSAIAQGLVGRSGPNPITEVHRLGETDARVYLLAQQEPGHPPVAVGLLKVGKKNLFHFDTSGRTTELRDQMCVLDFYVHEDWQRGGFGKMLFEAMLSNEGVDPSQLAYDVRARVLARSHPPDACPAESRVLGSRCVSLSLSLTRAAPIAQAHWLHGQALRAKRFRAATEQVCHLQTVLCRQAAVRARGGQHRDAHARTNDAHARSHPHFAITCTSWHAHLHQANLDL